MATGDASANSQQNFIFKIAGRIWTSLHERMGAIVGEFWSNLKKLNPVFSDTDWDNYCDLLVFDKLIDQDTANRLKRLSRYDFPWRQILMVSTLFKVKMADMKAVMEIYNLDRQYDLQAKTTPHPAPVEMLIRSMIIDPARATENRAELKKHGFNDLQIDNIILSHYRTVDEGTLRTQYLRGIINESRLYERMRELGYTDERSGEIIETWKVIPGPQDLFTMVAKEAFEPDMYIPMGLHLEFPSDQLPHLEKQGISKDWAEKYWIAHWEMPSIGQGFEMLHRDVITPAELDLLFRAVEIPDFWRDKLTKIAYSPFTRVDVRRMADMGVLEGLDLVQAYKDIGFDAEKAVDMYNFTIRFNEQGNAQLTRSAILESYREDLISHAQAVGLLLDQEYPEDLALYYLELEDYNYDKKLRDQKIDNIREQFLLNQLSLSMTRDALNRLDLRGSKVDSLIETWTLDAYKYAAIPSKSELDRFLVKGIITEGQYNSYLVRHGYSQTHISWYLEDMQPERVTAGKPPTRATLGTWYKRNVIDESRYRSEMAALGYTPEHIDLYFLAL